MIAMKTVPLTDRLATGILGALAAATIVVAAETHAFCSIFCIHGERMIEQNICTSRG